MIQGYDEKQKVLLKNWLIYSHNLAGSPVVVTKIIKLQVHEYNLNSFEMNIVFYHLRTAV